MKGLLQYGARRFIIAIPTVIGIVTVAFLLIHLAPGDPVDLLLGDYVTGEQRIIAAEELRQALGLDQPIGVQYIRYVRRVAVGDLGVSLRTKRPVASEILAHLPFTAALALTAICLAAVLGIPAGVLVALRRNSLADYVTTTVSMVWLSSPGFWLGLLAIYLFSYRLGWFPTFGGGSWTDLKSILLHLVLPTTSIAVRSMALLTRMTRSSMLEVLNQDYVRTARAKGLSERTVVYKHALRNAATSIVTVIGIDMAYLLSGSVVTETVFSRPGLGKLIVDAIYTRDYPVVQGVILVFALVMTISNFVVDLAYAAVDPRVKYS